MRHIIAFGLLAGGLVVLLLQGALALTGGEGVFGTLAYGYTTMVVSMVFVFLGVNRYRDVERGGVIGFWRALGVGAGIALVASLVYVACWEAYLAATDYAFMKDYVDGAIAAKTAEGLTGAELEAAIAPLEAYRRQYADTLYRIPGTLMEILPVGLMVALISAAILRDARAFPARSPATGPKP